MAAHAIFCRVKQFFTQLATRMSRGKVCRPEPLSISATASASPNTRSKSDVVEPDSEGRLLVNCRIKQIPLRVPLLNPHFPLAQLCEQPGVSEQATGG